MVRLCCWGLRCCALRELHWRGDEASPGCEEDCCPRSPWRSSFVTELLTPLCLWKRFESLCHTGAGSWLVLLGKGAPRALNFCGPVARSYLAPLWLVSRMKGGFSQEPLPAYILCHRAWKEYLPRASSWCGLPASLQQPLRRELRLESHLPPVPRLYSQGTFCGGVERCERCQKTGGRPHSGSSVR